MSFMKFASAFSHTARWALLSGFVLSAQAAEPLDAEHQRLHAERAQERAQERAAIQSQRVEIKARQQEAEQACWKRFAVQDCLNDIRRQARLDDSALRAREVSISDAERRERSAERLQEIERQKSQVRPPEPMQVSPRQPLTRPGAVEPKRTPAEIAEQQSSRQQEAQARAAEQASREQAHASALAARQAEEAARRAQASQQQAQKIQDAAQRRAAQQSAIDQRRGAPLPIPQGLPPAPKP